MIKFKMLTPSLAIAVLLGGCQPSTDTDSAAVEGGAEEAAVEGGTEAAAAGDEAAEEAAPEAEGDGVPTEMARIALDEGDSAIPATIEVPVGCTTFNDTPTTIRVEWADGEDFGVQIKEGNDYNTDLAEKATGLRENAYGVTNVIIEETETLLIWTSSSDGREPTFKFSLLQELAGKTWVCTQGNWGGWTREDIDTQIAACRTLVAK